MDQTTLRWISFVFEILQVVGALFALWLAAGIILDQIIDTGVIDQPEEWEDEDDESRDEFETESITEIEPEMGEPADEDAESTSLSAGVEAQAEPEIQAEALMPAAQEDLTSWIPRVNRPVALILWLVLAGFFYLPLSDLFSGLRTAVFLGIGWDQMAASPVANAWGVIEQGIYFLVTLVLMVVIYGVVLIVGRKFLSTNPDSLFADLPLSGMERLFILLGMGALFHYMVRNVILTLTWLELPTPAGQPVENALAFLAPALIVLAVLVLIILWMSSAVTRKDLEREEDLEFEADETEETDLAD